MTTLLREFRAVIFDCDGVLVDSERLGLRSLQQALLESGVERSLDYLTHFSGRSHGETLAELEAESGVSLMTGQTVRRMDDHYIRLVSEEGLASCPGVPELLLWLSSNQIPFTLASSGPRSKVQFSLLSAGLTGTFPRFVSGDDVKRAKPEPDLYLSAAKLLGTDPAACLAIEDAPNGIRAARLAGMQVVAVTTSFKAAALAEADLILDSLEELPQYFFRFQP